MRAILGVRIYLAHAKLLWIRVGAKPMPRFPRLVVPGYPHHVTQRGVRRQTTFFEDADYRAYVSLASELLPEFDLEFLAYCLMPNHIHAIVVPNERSALSRFFATLHRRYARRTNALHEWRGHLWQERFYSVVMDEPHTMSAMRYVELNPVRSGLVDSPHAWPWSSARCNLGMAPDGLINRQRTRRIVTNWRRYLAEGGTAKELDDLRRQTRTGRPEGRDTFLDELEARTGRPLRKKKRGRAPKKE